MRNSRNDDAVPKERYARHWCDRHQLSADREFIKQALGDQTTLKQVMHIKRVHFSGKGVDTTTPTAAPAGCD